MIKRIAFCAALAACTLGASAQIPAKGEVHYGLRLQGGVLNPGDWKYSKDLPVELDDERMFTDGLLLELGGMARVGLGSHFYLEPSLNIWYSRYRFYNFTIAEENGKPSEFNPKINAFGLTLPVVAGYTFEIGDAFAFSIFTGPEVTFWGAAKAKSDILEGGNNLLAKDSMMGGQRRWEMGWRFGVAIPYDRYELTIAGSLGMTDVRATPTTVTEHMNRFLIGLGYYF